MPSKIRSATIRSNNTPTQGIATAASAPDFWQPPRLLDIGDGILSTKPNKNVFNAIVTPPDDSTDWEQRDDLSVVAATLRLITNRETTLNYLEGAVGFS